MLTRMQCQTGRFYADRFCAKTMRATMLDSLAARRSGPFWMG